MESQKNLFGIFSSLVGSKFVGLNNYLSKGTGDLSNYRLCCNISEENMKRADLNKLKKVTDEDLVRLSNAKGIALEVFKIAITKLIASAEQNLSKELENRTTASQAQTDAYIPITKGIKINKASLNVHISGIEVSKTIIEKGEPKKATKHGDLVIAQNAIKDDKKLASLKYRTFVLSNADALKVSGEMILL